MPIDRPTLRDAASPAPPPGRTRRAALCASALIHAGLLGALATYAAERPPAPPRPQVTIRSSEASRSTAAPTCEVPPVLCEESTELPLHEPDVVRPIERPPLPIPEPPPPRSAPRLTNARIRPLPAPPPTEAPAPLLPVASEPFAAPARDAVDAAPLADNEPPVYPTAERARGHTGIVRLRVEVGRDGRAREVALASSSGHPALDRAAARAVRKWRFTPARVDGETMAGSCVVEVEFRMQS